MAISGGRTELLSEQCCNNEKYKERKQHGRNGQYKGIIRSGRNGDFQKEFYAEIDKIPRNRTITNVAINISEEAFKNMKDDPEYREKILSALKRDLTSSFAPLEASMVLTVGATAKDYRGDSWSGVNNQSEFYARSQNSFIKRQATRKIDKRAFGRISGKTGAG